MKLSKVFTKPGQSLIYIYDFGDSWEHEIILEYKEMKEWLGLKKNQNWDAEAFDLEIAKKLVQKI